MEKETPKKPSLMSALYNSVKRDPKSTTLNLLNAPKIQKKEMGKYNALGHIYQADIVYMKKGDKHGYVYLLVLVDIATRATDAIPMKTRTSLDVSNAFEQIKTNGYIDIDDIHYLYVDGGSEFKNWFKDYAEDNGIVIRTTLPARHKQNAIVESMNHLITKVTNNAMTADEIETGEINNDWSENVEKIVATLNDYKKEVKVGPLFEPPRVTQNEVDKMLKVGDIVHVILDQPKDHLNDKRLHGGFRNGDVRFKLEPTEIKDVVIVNNQPIRYLVNNPVNVSYIRKELLLADEKHQGDYVKNNPKAKPIEAPKQETKHRPSVIQTRSQTKFKFQTYQKKT